VSWDLVSRLRLRSWRVRIRLAVVVLAGAGLGAFLYVRHRTGDIFHPNARFVSEPSPTVPAKELDKSSWPLYGYTKEHNRFFPAAERLRPPFRQRWSRNFGTLLEFPPVIRGDHIFQLGDNGVLNAVSKHDGNTYWSRKLGSLSASTPAAVGRMVYATVLSGSRGGRVVALDYGKGRIVWSRNLSSRTESSPMVDGGRVYFGSQSGTVYAMDARTGNVIWTYQAGGAVKASPTLKNGVLYFGDYSGQVQAVRARDGHRLWRSGSGGAVLGSGTFYSTAAVAYGRVYLGNTDGRVYAYDAFNGKLDWAVQTGGYVYASPAVANAPGIGPTVFLGSYDGTFYALNARSGHTALQFGAGGRISGSATVVGRIVYFADLGDRRTYGLGVSTGRVVFRFKSGSFDPVISDGKDIFLTGYTGLYALAPR
jgi:outer membrane protein assembly factor BamB